MEKTFNRFIKEWTEWKHKIYLVRDRKKWTKIVKVLKNL